MKNRILIKAGIIIIPVLLILYNKPSNSYSQENTQKSSSIKELNDVLGGFDDQQDPALNKKDLNEPAGRFR